MVAKITPQLSYRIHCIAHVAGVEREESGDKDARVKRKAEREGTGLIPASLLLNSCPADKSISGKA